MVRFSIIIPNYNKEKYIDQCLKSIFNQTISKDKYEVIFIDDSSSDRSIDIASKYDIKLYLTNRLLAGGARNLGIEKSNGEYLIFLDSDDYLASNEVLELLDKHIKDEDLIFLNYNRQNLDKSVILKEEDMANTIKNMIENSKALGCPTKCFKKSIITKFDENVYFEDIYFTLYAMCNCKKYSFFKPPFFTYRYSEGSITKTNEISLKKMTDLTFEITKLYYLIDLFPKYKNNILSRIKKDNLNLRLDIINKYIETGENTFNKYF